MNKQKLTQNKKIAAIISIIILLIFIGLTGWFIGKPMLELVNQPETFRAWIQSKGWSGRLIFIAMVAIQVIFAVIPGEPLETGAGYAFGTIEGTFLCIAGFLIGSLVIYALVKKWGIRFVELFFSVDKINDLRFLNTTKKLNTVALLLFLIPGTPKDLLVYFLGLTNISMPAFLFTVTFARLPSLVTSTIAGNALGEKNYWEAALVFVIAALLSAIGYLAYRLISKYHSKKS